MQVITDPVGDTALGPFMEHRRNRVPIQAQGHALSYPVFDAELVAFRSVSPPLATRRGRNLRSHESQHGQTIKTYTEFY